MRNGQTEHYHSWTYQWPKAGRLPMILYMENPSIRISISIHPSQKHADLTALINHPGTICDTECLGDWIWHLWETFREWVNAEDFNGTMDQKCKKAQKERPIRVVTSSFQQTTSYKISRLLGKFNRVVHIPTKKSTFVIRLVKDDLGFTVSTFYVNVKKSMQNTEID
jgi:hypothetical protein